MDFITLSDSGDESDELPSFSERVRRLIGSESDSVKINNTPKKVTHSMSDNGSSSKESANVLSSRSISPDNITDEYRHLETAVDRNLCSKRNIPVHSLSDSDDSDSRETIPLSKGRSMSPVFSSPDVSISDIKALDDDPCHDALLLNKKTKSQKKKLDTEADKEKEERKKMKLEKKKEKDMVKALKASEKEILKSQKPEECIKNMKIVVDHNILNLEECQSALNSLDLNNLNYTIEKNSCKYSVNWYRRIINICTVDDEIVKQEIDNLEHVIIVIIPNEDFLKMVHAYSQRTKDKSIENASLEEFVVSIKSLYPECDITCVTIGFDKYNRKIKEEGTFDLKKIAKQIHKNAMEEVLIDLQLQSPINFHYLNNMTEFGSLLCQFTKAIAEAPQRKEKYMQKSLAFSWYADVDSSCPVKLSKDSSSFIKLWKQQIQQFHNVGPEVAEAIVSRYPTPRSLLKAYKRCITTKDAENILQDIVVRRNYGPLGTQKRIGPELAYKLYLFFTSKDGSQLLKR